MAALGINYVEAHLHVNDAMAIHQQLAAPLAATAEADDLTIPPEKNKQLPYKVWTGKLELHFKVQVPASTAKLRYIAGSLPSCVSSRHKALSLDPSYGSFA